MSEHSVSIENIKEQINYTPIYKINQLVDGDIDSVYVFYGQPIIKKNEKEIIKKIFTEQEIENIKNIYFSEQQIHRDDTIGIIKLKLLNELKKKCSLGEIYLFCQKFEYLNAISIFQSLTQNKKIKLTHQRLEQFLSNIDNSNGDAFIMPEQKDEYDLNDIIGMKLDGKKLVNKVLGQKFFIIENEYPFVCNPFKISAYDALLEKISRNSISTLNNNLLLNTGEIFLNNIFFCSANDVLSNIVKKDLSENTTLKIYYPFLYSKNIKSLERLQASESKLIDDDKEFLNTKTFESFKTIDMFYDIYKHKKSDLNYLKKGIKFIKAVIKPNFIVKIPLDVIFKIIHSTEINPLIKYNPSSRQENIYRLYTDQVAVDGKKIPYLKKATIFNLIKNIGKTKSVTVFIEFKNGSNNQTIYCEFNENGYITISSEFINAVSETEIDDIFRNNVNPIIEEVKSFLEQSGYKLDKFNSLNDENIEVKQLNYETQIEISKPFNIETYKGCIYSIFNNESSKKKGDMTLRFKRVANFNKVTSQEAFILQKQEEGFRGNEIINALLENFRDDLTRDKAIELLKKVANEIELESGVKKTDIKIKDNPGFKTTILLDKKTSIITIAVENINDINYLLTLPIYLDTIIRLTQDKTSTDYPAKEIKKLCSKDEIEDIILPDIDTSSEKYVSSIEEGSISEEDVSITYKKRKNNKKTALELLLGEDFEEEDIFGGEHTPSDKEEDSGSSIASEKGDLGSEEIIIDKPKENIDVQVEELKDEKIKEDSGSSVISEPVNLGTPSDKEEDSGSSIASDLGSLLPSLEDSGESVASEKGDLGSEEIVIDKPKENIDVQVEELKDEKIKEDSSSSVISEPVNLGTPSDKEEDSGSSIASDLGSLLPSLEDSGESVASEKGDLGSEEIVIDKPKENVVLEVEELEEKKPEPIKQVEVKPAKKIIIESDSESEEETKPLKKKPIKKVAIESDSDSEEENIEKNLDGISLRSYFQDKIEKYDSPLIIKKDVGNYSTYSKICQSQNKRQPVILTDTELKKINEEHKGFLRDEDVIKYGSDKNNQFNYICPRYWCLKTNSPIDPNEFEEKIENGKKVLVHPTCGKILPSDRKSKDDKIIPGHYVYEFYKEGENKRYPGFQTDKHPKGFCLPCCFDKYNTVGRMEAKAKCSAPSEDKDEDEDKDKDKDEKIKEKVKKEKDEDLDEYVKGPEKFPLSPGRWGYLPIPIQKILHEINADCQISKTNTNIKQNHPCLLRHGVEVSERQSFIACISDAVFYAREILDSDGKKTGNLAKVISIVKMREKIIKSLTIDNFIKYQNGNLVSDFYDPNKNIDMNNLNEKYTKNVKLYSKLNMSIEADNLFYKKVISAFENFINFLSDDDAIIDHTYLWDLVCMSNKYIFGQDGINLVIFEIPNDDITSNVQLVCPSNHYSTEFYDASKPTLFLLKEGNYYEPIYSYTINNRKLSIKKVFSERNPHLSSSMKAVFSEIVKPFFNLMCKPQPSMPTEGLPLPKVYTAKRPLLLHNLVDKIQGYEGYKILKLVVNFHNKVIGVLVENPLKIKGFVPCYPSRIENNFKEDIDYVLMTDLELWNTYDNTIEFLKGLEKRSKKKRPSPDIPCAPAFKVMEDDEVIVGILTETNQFIQLSEPITEGEIKPENNIPSFKNSNYIVNKETRPMVQSDVLISTSNKVDEERVDFVKKIKFETNFYNVFRNTIRILLNDYENNKIKEQIEIEMLKEYLIYSQKLKNITDLLKTLVDDKIQFIGDDNYYKLIDEVSTCIVKDKNSCSKSPNLCAVTENGKCRLILPRKSLIAFDKTKKEYKLNEPIYFEKMSDELIRYNRIKSFMLQPQTYLSFGNIGYNLRDNEIIMLQSLLTQDYFENIIPVIVNKYVKQISYDEAEPLITQPYDNVVPSLNEAIGRKHTDVCPTLKKKIGSGKWNKCFPDAFKEIQYGTKGNKSNYCTFIFIIDLIERKIAKKLVVNDIKKILYEEYSKYLVKFGSQIIDILITEGKQNFGRQVKGDNLSFIDFITTNNYFLTAFDLWLLVQKFEIPTIFISTTKLLETNNKEHFFIGYGNENDDFAFVVVPGVSPENVPSFKLIEADNNDVFISLNKLLKCEYKIKIEEAFKNKIVVEVFLREFNPKNLEKKKLKIEDSSQDEEEDEAVKPKAKKAKKPLIIESSSPVSSEEAVTKKKGKTKKTKLVGIKPKTKKNK
jgi:hypothetical protein